MSYLQAALQYIRDIWRGFKCFRQIKEAGYESHAQRLARLTGNKYDAWAFQICDTDELYMLVGYYYEDDEIFQDPSRRLLLLGEGSTEPQEANSRTKIYNLGLIEGLVEAESESSTMIRMRRVGSFKGLPEIPLRCGEEAICGLLY